MTSEVQTQLIEKVTGAGESAIPIIIACVGAAAVIFAIGLGIRYGKKFFKGMAS